MDSLESELRITKLDDNISYIEPTINPLSANVVIINGKDAVWLYDVGNHPDIPDMLEYYIRTECCDYESDYVLQNKKLNKKVNIVLSHFHQDHIGNITHICERFDCGNIYQGRLTYKHTHMGNVVDNDICIDDGNVSLHIFPLPSSHAKGSVALEVNNKYCFLGDGLYAMQKGSQRLYNSGILKEEINALKIIRAEKFMCSHKTPFGRSKAGVIRWLESIYNMRVKDSQYIDYSL